LVVWVSRFFVSEEVLVDAGEGNPWRYHRFSGSRYTQ
jgi:hypothetical protein